MSKSKKVVSHKDAHKALVNAGWVLIKGAGKGAHIKFKKPHNPTIVLSKHGKDIDPKAAKELLSLGII